MDVDEPPDGRTPSLVELLQDSFNVVGVSEEKQELAYSFLTRLFQKDSETHQHSIEVGLLMLDAKRYLENSGYCFMFNDEEALLSGLLHDVGKLRIDRSLLTKKNFDRGGSDGHQIETHVEEGFRELRG